MSPHQIQKADVIHVYNNPNLDLSAVYDLYEKCLKTKTFVSVDSIMQASSSFAEFFTAAVVKPNDVVVLGGNVFTQNAKLDLLETDHKFKKCVTSLFTGKVVILDDPLNTFRVPNVFPKIHYLVLGKNYTCNRLLNNRKSVVLTSHATIFPKDVVNLHTITNRTLNPNHKDFTYDPVEIYHMHHKYTKFVSNK